MNKGYNNYVILLRQGLGVNPTLYNKVVEEGVSLRVITEYNKFNKSR